MATSSPRMKLESSVRRNRDQAGDFFGATHRFKSVRSTNCFCSSAFMPIFAIAGVMIGPGLSVFTRPCIKSNSAGLVDRDNVAFQKAFHIIIAIDTTINAPDVAGTWTSTSLDSLL